MYISFFGLPSKMDDSEEGVKAKKAKYFCTELFRKELKGSEALKSIIASYYLCFL